MEIFLGIFVIILCVLLEGFFAGSEIGFISCNRIRMNHLADNNNKRAKIVMSFLDNPEKFLSTTLVGVNLCVIIGSSVATDLASKFIKTPGHDAFIATLVVFPMVLIFGELVPKIIYQNYPNVSSLFASYPLKWASYILFPFVFSATKISGAITRMFAKGKPDKSPYVTREEIRLLMLDASKRGILDKEEIDMTSEIFDFSRTHVHSVMVPLSKVVSASDQSTTKDVLELVSQIGYSRIPIYSGSEENIIGTIEMSDLVSEDIEKQDLSKLILPPYKVGEHKELGEMLKDFQQNEENVAIVTNKEGKAIGIATIEDIVEEIFGEIEDEYDVARRS
ncbi:MAG: hemolysin family protein [Candidatus Omnitrophota bacterium]